VRFSSPGSPGDFFPGRGAPQQPPFRSYGRLAVSRCGPLQQDWRSAAFLRRAGVSGPLSRWPIVGGRCHPFRHKRRVRRRVKHPHAVLASNDPQAIVLDVMQPAGAVVAEIIPRSGFIDRRRRAHSAGTAGRFMRYFRHTSVRSKTWIANTLRARLTR
jgi:hypothetical protein